MVALHSIWKEWRTLLAVEGLEEGPPNFSVSPVFLWKDWNRALPIQRRVVPSSYIWKFSKLKILSIADCCKSSIASYMPRAKAFGSTRKFKV